MKKTTAALTIASLLGSTVAAVAEQCTNETWNKIQERGTIVVGVKADTKPWGFRGENGDLIGMEADMAKEVADTLGVELELVGVQSSNRMQFLEGGRIDLMIATMSDRTDRREIVGVVGPNYYSSGTNIMAPKALGIDEWSDLEGKPVCGKQGAFYNQIIEDRYGAQIVAFTGNAEAKQALRDRKCIAWVYDDSVIAADLASGNFDDFEMPLTSEDDNPWGLAVPIAERNCVFGRFMSGMQYNWHQSGDLIALEEKWGIQATAYLQRENERFKDWLAE
ncbi:transporter substrate-binding domain-containing protein [Cognatishimia sp. SS12]|uniref:transporter substrate-binding domain-containing protein n=1 Tax=Cognatishimia sp. SS12 TaxID=2979465 RepID=UPI002330E4FF|nr:transporter substrate-binding domain-containing protein [Cognatishimia sp. SS12]MDC0738294.1 transporter substrate-binding domain-containing protein [Cognatishimia sp. SS12]